MAVRRRRFTPYRPPAPPAGTYDPSLDAQEAAARRGYIDLRGDVERGGLRAQDDYGLQTQQIERERGWGLEDAGLSRSRGMADLLQSRDRGLSDLSTRETRGGEDYNRSVAQLSRNYGILGRNQLQAGNAAGVLRGGAMLQAAAKRTENEAWDRQPIDTSWRREQQDIGESRGRLQQDYSTQTNRLEEDYSRGQGRVNQGADWNIGVAGLGYQRQAEDLNTQLTRGGRELGAFSLDTGAQRAYQAAGAGWDPGAGPSNEYTKGNQTYRVVREGNRSVAYLPSGRVLWRRPYRGR